MNIVDLFSAAGILGSICLAFGLLITLSNKQFYVWEDPRIGEVEELLPGTNCGACANPGCHAFAERLVEGEEEPAACTVLGKDDIEDVAGYLGVDAGEAVKRIARVLCAGGQKEAVQMAQYQGFDTCKAAAQVAGGGKGCTWGCLGLGDCADSCDHNAMTMNDNGLPVVNPDACIACDDCAIACPKDLIELMPQQDNLLVQCKNLQVGDSAEVLCSVACNSCGKCVHDAPKGQIHMENGLAIINYDHDAPLSPDATNRCPTNAIAWVEGQQFPLSMPAGQVSEKKNNLSDMARTLTNFKPLRTTK